MLVLKRLRSTPMFQNGYRQDLESTDRLVDVNNKKNLVIIKKTSKMYIFDVIYKLCVILKTETDDNNYIHNTKLSRIILKER
jgi:hypothetical protein